MQAKLLTRAITNHNHNIRSFPLPDNDDKPFKILNSMDRKTLLWNQFHFHNNVERIQRHRLQLQSTKLNHKTDLSGVTIWMSCS